MRALALGLAGGLFATVTALAAPPELAAYVTDDNKDVYVALYGDVAVELAGCPTEAAARSLVALPAAAIAQTTLAELQAAHPLTHPKIPCTPEAKFDADFAATTPVWFDLNGTRRYYLPSPAAQGTFYSIPSRCTAIKEAFALRQRIVLPGVLQAETAPPQGAIVSEIVLDCGDGQARPPEPGDGEMAAGDRWSLHDTDVFLSGDTLDTIYVAVHLRVTSAGVEKNYLPIHRINGAPASQAVWEGSNSRSQVESALKELFGIKADEAVTTLGAEGLARINKAPFLDLCLTRCDGYRHQHGFFPQPDIGFDLVGLPQPIATRQFDLLGETFYRWSFADGRAASFGGCDRLTAAMGLILPGPETAAWGDAVGKVHGLAPSGEAPFVCSPPAAETCVRRVAEGGTLSQALFARDASCQAARRLRIELPARATIASTLVVDGASFQDVEVAPKDPLGASALTVALPQANAVASSCPFEPAPAVIHARNLARLKLARLSLARAGDGPTQELTAMILENTKAAFDHVGIGSIGEGQRPIERTLRLCNTELYVLGGAYRSTLLALHGMNSRVSFAGPGATDTASITTENFGLFMMSGSVIRMSWTALTAPRAMLLRGSEIKGTHVDLDAGSVSTTSSGLRLERGSNAALSVSSARRFACLGVFPDATSSASFTLPTNALAADNTRVNCGSGAIEINE